MKKKQSILKLGLATMLCFFSFVLFAQDPTDSLPGDPGAIYAYTTQHLKFGAFTQGAGGGTVIISTAGSRSVTGSVTGLNQGVTYCQAIFEVEAPPGSIVSILNGPNATLTGSNGGTMTLQIGSSSPGSPFNTTVSPPARTQVNVAGTLTVGDSSASPPGSYSGNFYITFNLE